MEPVWIELFLFFFVPKKGGPRPLDVLEKGEQAVVFLHFKKLFRALDGTSTEMHHCMYGSSRRKLTRLIHNIQSFHDLRKLCDNKHEHEPWGRKPVEELPKIAERVAQWEEKIKQFRSSCAQVAWDDPVAFMLQHDGYRMPLADLIAPTIGGGNCKGSYANLVEQFADGSWATAEETAYPWPLARAIAVQVVIQRQAQGLACHLPSFAGMHVASNACGWMPLNQAMKYNPSKA